MIDKLVPSSAIFAITERCNLACKYPCYTRFENYIPIKDSYEVTENLMSFLLAQSEVLKNKPSIHFFGGEPLMAYETILKAMKAGRDKFKWSMTTNATLLTKERYNELISAGLTGILFSIDGPEEVHDKNRVYKDDSGSFKSVLENINYLRSIDHLKRYECRGTVCTNTVHKFFQSYIYLVDLGFGAVTILAAFENDWTDSYLEVYEEQLTKLAVWWIDNARKNVFVSVHQFDHGFRCLLLPTSNEKPCGLGDRVLGVTADGRFVPCHRLATRRKMPIEWDLGNVFDGINIENFMKSIEWDRSKLRSAAGYDCSMCPARSACTAMCIATNWDMAGNPEDPGGRYLVAKSICDMNLINVRVAAMIFSILKEDVKFQRWLIQKRFIKEGGVLPFYDPRKVQREPAEKRIKCEKCLECQVCYTAQKCTECQVCYTPQATNSR